MESYVVLEGVSGKQERDRDPFLARLILIIESQLTDLEEDREEK